MTKIKTRPCVNSATLKDGKIACEKRRNIFPSPSSEEEEIVDLGFFGKIKEFFLYYLERRKWSKFKKTGLQKLPPPTFEYSDGLGWPYVLEISRVNEYGQFVTLHRYPNGSIVDENVHSSVTQVINEEKRVGGSLFRCN